jgi:hypothetical protein
MTPFGARISVRSTLCSADIEDPVHKSPWYKLPKCSDTFGALIVVEVLPFPCHQLHGIPSYRDIIQFFENPPGRLSLEKPNLNAI